MFLQDEDDEDGEPKKSKLSNNAKGKAPSPKKNAKKWAGSRGQRCGARAGRAWTMTFGSSRLHIVHFDPHFDQDSRGLGRFSTTARRPFAKFWCRYPFFLY